MSDLRTLLRDHVDSEVPAMDIDRLVDDLYETELPGAARTKRPPRRLVAAAAVAVLTLLAVGGVLLLTADDQTEPVATTPPPIPTTGPPDGPALELFEWQSAEMPGEIVSLLAFDDAYVAHLITPEGYPSASASWLVTSTDGLNWAPLLEQPQWAGRGRSLGVFMFDGRLWTAAVVDHEGVELTVERLDTIGLGWDPVPVEAPEAADLRHIEFVAGPGGALLFAVADSGRPVLWVLGDNGFERIDGSSMESLPFAGHESGWVDGDGLIRSIDMFATESGFIGVVIADESAAVPAALSSPDGRSWVPISDMPDLWFVPNGVGLREGDFQAFGEGGLYRSTDDGLSWTLLGSELEAMSIAGGPLGWIAPDGQVGIFWDGPTDLLFSTDGVHWEIALEDAPVVHSMLVTDEAVLFGSSRGGWGPATYEVWIGRPRY